MTDRVTDQPDQSGAQHEDDAVPVLITFALLFLLSAAVWFVLDRIRSDEVQSQVSQVSEHSTSTPGTRPNKVAAAK